MQPSWDTRLRCPGCRNKKKGQDPCFGGKSCGAGLHSLDSRKIGISTSSRIYAGPSPSKTTNRSGVDCSSSPRLGVTVLITSQLRNHRNSHLTVTSHLRTVTGQPRTGTGQPRTGTSQANTGPTVTRAPSLLTKLHLGAWKQPFWAH